MTECSRGFKHQTMNEVPQLWWLCSSTMSPPVMHYYLLCPGSGMIAATSEKITMTEYQQITSLVFPIGPGGAQVQCYYS